MADTVSVTISLADSAPKLGDFGTIALFGKCPFGVDPRTYDANATGLAAMVTDGFAVNDEVYVMASACAAQTNGQTQVKCYPRDSGNNAREYLVTVGYTTVGKRYTGTVEGKGGAVSFDYTVQAGDANTDIVDGIEADLVATAMTIVINDNTDGAHSITLKHPDGNETFTFNASTSTIADIAAGLAALIDASDKFIATDDTVDTITATRLDGGALKYTVTTAPSTIATVTEGTGPSVGTYVTFTDNADGTFTLTPTVTGETFWISNFVEALQVNDESADAGIGTDLAAGAVADNNFYGFAIDSTSAAEIEAARTWANANGKVFVGMTRDYDVGTNSELDVATSVNNSAGNYSKVMWHGNTKERVDCAVLSKWFGLGPAAGVEYLKLQGCTAPSRSATFKGWLDTKLVGYVKLERGESFTHNMKFPGRYPDLTRGFDWFQDRIEAALLQVLLNGAVTGGVPFTDEGVGRFVGALMSEATVGVDNGLLARTPAPRVETVLVADVSSLDKAARTLNGLKLYATLAGKVESLNVEVIVTP